MEIPSERAVFSKTLVLAFVNKELNTKVMSQGNKRVFKVTFEFDDRSILDMQRVFGIEFWGRNYPHCDDLKLYSTWLDHEHCGDTTIPIVKFIYQGDVQTVTRERVLETSTVAVLGWLADHNCQVSFTRVIADTSANEPTDLFESEDMTPEARAIESEFNGLRNANPGNI